MYLSISVTTCKMLVNSQTKRNGLSYEAKLKKQMSREKAVDLVHKCSHDTDNSPECKVFWKYLDTFETDLNKFNSLMMVMLYRDMLETDSSEYCEILENEDDEFCKMVLDDDIYDTFVDI